MKSRVNDILLLIVEVESRISLERRRLNKLSYDAIVLSQYESIQEELLRMLSKELEHHKAQVTTLDISKIIDNTIDIQGWKFYGDILGINIIDSSRDEK